MNARTYSISSFATFSIRLFNIDVLYLIKSASNRKYQFIDAFIQHHEIKDRHSRLRGNDGGKAFSTMFGSVYRKPA